MQFTVYKPLEPYHEIRRFLDNVRVGNRCIGSKTTIPKVVDFDPLLMGFDLDHYIGKGLQEPWKSFQITSTDPSRP